MIKGIGCVSLKSTLYLWVTPEFTQSLKGQESEKIHSAGVESYLIKLGRYPWYVNGPPELWIHDRKPKLLKVYQKINTDNVPSVSSPSSHKIHSETEKALGDRKRQCL